jgi:hypothetical protein
MGDIGGCNERGGNMNRGREKGENIKEKGRKRQENESYSQMGKINAKGVLKKRQDG